MRHKIPFLRYQLIVICLFLSGCFSPPDNHFKADNRQSANLARSTIVGAGLGAMAGAVATTSSGAYGAGAVLGGAIGAFYHAHNTTRNKLLQKLANYDIQYVKRGDSITLIIPTDKFYQFNSGEINDLCYSGLMHVVNLIKRYPCQPIFVAGFTDDVGSKMHKRALSNAQAQSMVGFLWAHNISAERLHPEGYSDKHPIANNQLIRGSAMNRRIEIQWFDISGQTGCSKAHKRPPMLDKFGRVVS